MATAKNGESATAPPQRPTITLPPRPSMEAFFSGGFAGASPGPMTLVSSFFSDNYPDSDCRSFSQLLAGAMASPLALTARPSFFPDNSTDNSSKEAAAEDGAQKNLGFKQSRPMNLVVARSPLFTVPPGLSPSGLLNSPGFFPPQVIQGIWVLRFSCKLWFHCWLDICGDSLCELRQLNRCLYW